MKQRKKLIGVLLSSAMLLTSIMPVSVPAAEPGDAQGEAGAQPGLKMWYSSPATDWESEASPLGNGFMGAMIFGGVDSDQNHLAPETVVTSAMKRVDNASYDITKAVLEGTYTPGVHIYSLEDGGVDIAPTTDLLPDDVLAAVEEAKQAIINGEIVVPATQEDFEAKYGPDVYQLD